MHDNMILFSKIGGPIFQEEGAICYQKHYQLTFISEYKGWLIPVQCLQHMLQTYMITYNVLFLRKK